MTIEHILPQAWQANWPLDPDDLAGAVERDHHVHRLGNLTLVSGRLNPALSNRPWVGEAGAGKRDYLLKHSALKLNAEVVSSHPDSWTEDDIRARTQAMTDKLLTFWPRPASAAAVSIVEVEVEVEVEPQPAAATDAQFADDEDASIAPHTGKYRLLYWWLKGQDGDELSLTFEQVEQVAGIALPPSARLHPAHWYGYEGSAIARAVRDAGWKASKVDLPSERLTFVRAGDDG